MSLSRSEEKLLLDYADIFRISPAAFSENRGAAYAILTALYGYLSLDADAERKQLRDAVLVESNAQFGNGLFFGQVQGAVALLMIQPAWFSRRKTNAELIKQFKYLLVGATALSVIGISPIGGSARKGVEDTIKVGGSVSKGIEAAKKRLLMGAGSGIVEAITTRFATRFPVGLAFVAALTIAYMGMLEKMEDIRTEMMERFDVGLATRDELNQIQNASFFAIIEQGLQEYW